MNTNQSTQTRQSNNQSTPAARPASTQKSQQDHDQYDDGLVHNHNWASSAR